MEELILALFWLMMLISFFWLMNDWAGDGKITTTYKKIKDRNSLYECTRCDRLFREYQRDLVRSAKGYESCPHCDQSRYGIGGINKPDKWMDSHTDCPKISIPSYIKILKAIKTVKKLRKEKEEIERFEKYNNLKADVDWIIKLQKDLSK